MEELHDKVTLPGVSADVCICMNVRMYVNMLCVCVCVRMYVCTSQKSVPVVYICVASFTYVCHVISVCVMR